MNAAYFNDELIEDVTSERRRLTNEERTFLVEDGIRLEECSATPEELQAMNDKDLMNTIYSAWSDYVR